MDTGLAAGNHTFTSEVLYQLSYVGAARILASGQALVPTRSGFLRDVPTMFQRPRLIRMP